MEIDTCGVCKSFTPIGDGRIGLCYDPENPPDLRGVNLAAWTVQRDDKPCDSNQFRRKEK